MQASAAFSVLALLRQALWRVSRVRTLPVEWTDVLEPDLVVTVGAGRALFRTDQLRELRKLLDECRRQRKVPSC